MDVEKPLGVPDSASEGASFLKVMWGGGFTSPMEEPAFRNPTEHRLSVPPEFQPKLGKDGCCLPTCDWGSMGGSTSGRPWLQAGPPTRSVEGDREQGDGWHAYFPSLCFTSFHRVIVS